MIAALVAFALALPVAKSGQAAEPALRALAERSAVRWKPPAKRVLAFYYPWYGSFEFGGRWRHWEGVDGLRKRIGSSTHYPRLGPYDSLDPRVVERHSLWAKEAGLDGWIVSWWGRGDRTDRAMPLILDEAARRGLVVTVYHELIPEPPTVANAISDLKYLIQRYGSHRAWLKEHGKPVVFVYGRSVGQIGVFGWAEAIAGLNRQLRDGVWVIGDDMSPLATRTFDGVHTYNTADRLRGIPAAEVGRVVESVFAKALGRADANGRVGCVTLVPGYDDTKVRQPGLIVSRFGGASYRAQWEAALRLNPDWVLVTSFNEWHEGSEIEPSEEHGDLYLRITSEFTARFRSRPPRKKSAAPAMDAKSRATVVEALGTRSVGLLPSPSSTASPWLADVFPNLRMVSWDEVAGGLAGTRLALLAFAGGERYTRTVKREGDVEEGLRRFLENGGALLVAGSEPLPFYYDERGQAVDTLAKLGMRLATGGSGLPRGFESPPPGEELAFVFDKRLFPDGPERAHFPNAADPRWRPALGVGQASGARLLRLATLRDAMGRDWGAGAAVLVFERGGKIGYIWFNLLDEPYGEALLGALVRLLLSP